MATFKVEEGYADLSSKALEIVETSLKLWKVAPRKALAPM